MLGDEAAKFVAATASHEFEELHVPAVLVIIKSVLERHVLGKIGLHVPMQMRHRARRRQHRASSGGFDRAARCDAQRLHLVQRRIGEVIGIVVGRDRHHRDVPVGVQQVQRGDGGVVHPHAGVLHRAHRQALLLSLGNDCFGEFHIGFEIVVIAEEVRKDRVHRHALRVFHAVHMVADRGDPVRRMHQDHVGLVNFFHALSHRLVAPADLLPAAARTRLVVRVILGVDQVRRMRREQAGDDTGRVCIALCRAG